MDYGQLIALAKKKSDEASNSIKKNKFKQAGGPRSEGD